MIPENAPALCSNGTKRKCDDERGPMPPEYETRTESLLLGPKWHGLSYRNLAEKPAAIGVEGLSAT